MMTPEPDRADRFVDQARAAVGNAGAPVVQLGAYEGPLDLLLALARAQRVDLAQLSITALAAQFAAAVDRALAHRNAPLPRLAEWLIMAAWLVALRARLLLPAEAEGSAEARREAEGLRQRLADRAAALRLADWLERRLQLGRAVFGRGASEPDAGACRRLTSPSCCGPAASCWTCRRASGCTGRARPCSGGRRMPWCGSASCCPTCRRAPPWGSSCRRQPGKTRLCGSAAPWPARCWPGLN
jgi:hypothetical protein